MSAGWYLLAYDIADPRRLQRVHYRVKQRGVAVQQSVFFVHATEGELTTLLDELSALIQPREDDIRAYPIAHPGEVWLSGQRPLSGRLLHTGDKSNRPAPVQPKRRGLGQLLARLWEKA